MKWFRAVAVAVAIAFEWTDSGKSGARRECHRKNNLCSYVCLREPRLWWRRWQLGRSSTSIGLLYALRVGKSFYFLAFQQLDSHKWENNQKKTAEKLNASLSLANQRTFRISVSNVDQSPTRCCEKKGIIGGVLH